MMVPAVVAAVPGSALNADSRGARIDPVFLFTGSRACVERYASEELVAWFVQHRRLTVEEFEAQW